MSVWGHAHVVWARWLLEKKVVECQKCGIKPTETRGNCKSPYDNFHFETGYYSNNYFVSISLNLTGCMKLIYDKITEIYIYQFKVNQKSGDFESRFVSNLEKVQVWSNQLFSQVCNCRLKSRFETRHFSRFEIQV